MSDAGESGDSLEVEVVCPGCGGQWQSKSFPCPTCDGTGYILTELGRKVMAMVLRKLGQTFRDAIDR